MRKYIRFIRLKFAKNKKGECSKFEKEIDYNFYKKKKKKKKNS